VAAASVLVKQQLPHPQSLAAAVTQSVLFRSPRRRFVCAPHSPRPPDSFGYRAETLDSLEDPVWSEDLSANEINALPSLK
jgi:hypothetical protein